MANTLADAPTSATTIGDTDLMHIKVGTGTNSDKKITGANVKAMFATAAQGGTADTAVQPGDDANTLGSGAATDGYVLTADGAGNAAWEEPAGGGISSVSDDTSPTLGGDLSLGGFKLLSGASNDAVIKLGDNAGARKFSVTDSDDADILQVFSDEETGGVVFGPDATRSAFRLYRSGATTSIELNRKGNSSGGLRIGSDNNTSTIQRTATGGQYGLELRAAGVYILGNATANSSEAWLFGLTENTPNGGAAASFNIKADNNTSRDRAGTPLKLFGGDALTGNHNGGNIVLTGGAGSGTGSRGLIVVDLSSLPTSDPSVNGALWLNSGTLTVSGA